MRVLFMLVNDGGSAGPEKTNQSDGSKGQESAVTYPEAKTKSPSKDGGVWEKVKRYCKINI